MRDFSQPEAVGDVVEDRHVREQAIALEHGGGVTLVRRQHGHFLIADINLTLGGQLKACNHAQGGGLAATRGTKKGYQLAGLDDKVRIIDCNYVSLSFYILEFLGYMLKGYRYTFLFHESPP